jgi:hypothetical protein
MSPAADRLVAFQVEFQVVKQSCISRVERSWKGRSLPISRVERSWKRRSLPGMGAVEFERRRAKLGQIRRASDLDEDQQKLWAQGDIDRAARGGEALEFLE